MHKKDIRDKADKLLAAGVGRTAVFHLLSGKGMREAQLAHHIAAYADPELCREHRGQVDNLVFLMVIQALIAFAMGWGLGVKIGPNVKWTVALIAAALPVLFAWGFHRNRVWAYNGYILLAIVQLPKFMEGIQAEPVSTMVALAISIGIVVYVWVVRDRIFPGFAFVSPKKVKGRYSFAT